MLWGRTRFARWYICIQKCRFGLVGMEKFGIFWAIWNIYCHLVCFVVIWYAFWYADPWNIWIPWDVHTFLHLTIIGLAPAWRFFFGGLFQMLYSNFEPRNIVGHLVSEFDMFTLPFRGIHRKKPKQNQSSISLSLSLSLSHTHTHTHTQTTVVVGAQNRWCWFIF
jgi:hypothetical protein